MNNNWTTYKCKDVGDEYEPINLKDDESLVHDLFQDDPIIRSQERLKAEKANGVWVPRILLFCYSFEMESESVL